MQEHRIEFHETKSIPPDNLRGLYEANGWSSARGPELLARAIANSHSVVSAWHGERLVGLGNTLSDGLMVVYYLHLLVHPYYQRKCVGSAIARRLMARYHNFHQQVLLAEGSAAGFYRKMGFERATSIEPMWQAGF